MVARVETVEVGVSGTADFSEAPYEEIPQTNELERSIIWNMFFRQLLKALR